MTHQRLRKFNTRDVYKGQGVDNDVCMVVRAGDRIYLRGQTGLDLDQRLVAPEDAGEQAHQAMRNAKVLLEEAGSGIDHVTRTITYITDRAYREPVYNAVYEHMKGVPTVGTGLVVKGLAMPQMKMEIDIDAVIPRAGEDHERLRRFNTRNWFGQRIDRESCMVVKTPGEIFLRGQTGTALDGSRQYGKGYTREAAAEQADVAMRNAKTLLEEAGSGLHDVCKTRIYIRDRAYREAVYQVIGRHFGDVHPCSTGLIMGGFARPEILFEIDMQVVPSSGVPHQRIRKFETANQYKDGQDLRCRFCMAVRAGDKVFLRGQTGTTFDGQFVGLDDAGAQADQAMKNVRQLLEEAGAGLQDICKVTIFIADRAFRDPVYRTVGRHLKGVYPVSTGLIVDGFANPRILVEIDIEAVVQG